MEISAIGNREDPDPLGPLFVALADPTRRRIIERLRDREQTVSELAHGLDIGAPSVSKHLTVLEHAGLVSRQREAQWRRCRLEAIAFERLQQWLDHYAQLWPGSLDRLETHLRSKEAR
ncbi:ArsR/SmtB family transcription factor [Lysobacter korlensis]|uniref:ArsR/SmtB family transcription factor n=1 Tax=Lysobacter korlensis TaxID=553636 RepID=A0ABV6RZ87_9GAMM